MTLEERLDADLKDAMRSGDDHPQAGDPRGEDRHHRSEGRGAGGAHSDATPTCWPDHQKQVKQRRDSIAEFAKGGRQDLMAQEEAEIAVLETYLPKQLSEAEIRERARAVIAELGVSDMKGIGPVMKRLTRRPARPRGRPGGQSGGARTARPGVTGSSTHLILLARPSADPVTTHRHCPPQQDIPWRARCAS